MPEIVHQKFAQSSAKNLEVKVNNQKTFQSNTGVKMILIESLTKRYNYIHQSHTAFCFFDRRNRDIKKSANFTLSGCVFWPKTLTFPRIQKQADNEVDKLMKQIKKVFLSLILDLVHFFYYKMTNESVSNLKIQKKSEASDVVKLICIIIGVSLANSAKLQSCAKQTAHKHQGHQKMDSYSALFIQKRGQAELHGWKIMANYKINLRLMIPRGLIQQLNELRALDITRAAPFEVLSANPALPETQEALYFTQVLKLLQSCEDFRLQDTTKYLAKKYFDAFVKQYPRVKQTDPYLLIITCVRVATKFNEPSEFSEYYTIDCCLRQAQGSGVRYRPEDFVDFQAKLLTVLDFRLRKISPYEFIVVEELLPELRKAKQILCSILDFSLTLPEIRHANAEELFFGSLIFSCRYKQEDPICFLFIQAITDRYHEACQVAALIAQKMRSLAP